MPHDWLDDDARRAEVGIPSRVRFREKWRIALAQVRAVLTRGFQVTAVVTDADYGSIVGFRHGLERLGLRYAVAIRSNLTLWRSGARRAYTATALAAQIPTRHWQRVCWGHGTKGPLAARFVAELSPGTFCTLRCELSSFGGPFHVGGRPACPRGVERCERRADDHPL